MGKRKILIVEDETIAAMALGFYLEDKGCEVLDFSVSGEDAVKVAKAERPDIIFMDVNLSGAMDGIEAAEIIAREGPVAIIFMTGFSNKSVIERITERNPSVYLEKPFDFTAIDGILSSMA
jgi:two-component system, response regulator PdtaR